MHSIDGHAQLLADGLMGPLAPAQQDSVARIRRAVRSMLALVDDLLELSRAEAGQVRVAAEPTDLDALLRDTVEEHRAAARVAGHRLDLAVADALPDVVTDPERVRQVLGNLLSNAVKYTPEGGRIAVRAELRARGDGNGDGRGDGRGDGHAARRWMAIDVADTGPGIPGDQLDAIFDEFARLPAHAAQPGSGLGLSIARRIATLLGGDVTVRNEPQGGARFTLWLPADRQPRAAAPRGA
jgi:signal transduction histidine kinase